MKRKLKFTVTMMMIVALCGCQAGVQQSNTNNAEPSPSAPQITEAGRITLPVLDALLSEEAFRSDLKSKLQLTDDEIASLRKISSDEVATLRRTNAEQQPAGAEDPRQRAEEAIRRIVGEEKSARLLALAQERWSKGSDEIEANAGKPDEPEMLKGPNAIPNDTRIVVNIPTFRMDVFHDGSLVKSYKIGIGYPQFPLPIGLRQAQMLIFNPTWTPPDSPWVNTMKVTPGEVIEAGSKQNPLGPIKIPIGSPSLIHGGKPLAKIGAFASHGCVGLTNVQVKDFARVLAEVSNTKLAANTMAAYLKTPTKTRTVKLDKTVPVELRYETIVVEDGRLHIYRDVYDQNTSTEENLRAVLEANGASFDNLSSEEKQQTLDALNMMSSHSKKQPTPKPTVSANQNSAERASAAAARKAEADRQKKLRNQKEVVIEITGLAGKGYPAPVNLDNGTGTIASATTPKPK